MGSENAVHLVGASADSGLPQEHLGEDESERGHGVEGEAAGALRTS